MSGFSSPFMAKSPLKDVREEEHMHVGEATDKIQKDKTSEYVVNMFDNDTLRPVGKKFNRNKTLDGYLIGGNYPTVKTSDKNYQLKPVDPDAPGTPGKPGYEPPVVREELDDKGKEIYDNLRKEKEQK